MHRVRRPQLPHAEGDSRRGSPRAEEVLSQGAQAHAAQGIAQEVVVSCQWSVVSEQWYFTDNRSLATDNYPRGVAQLAEQPSPKRQVERSTRSAPADVPAGRPWDDAAALEEVRDGHVRR